MLAAGCSCVPDAGAPWLVFGILALGSVALLAAAGRWHRRSATADRRLAVRASLAAGVLAAMAATVVVVAPGTDGSVVVLGAGVVVASAGVAPASWRREAPVP